MGGGEHRAQVGLPRRNERPCDDPTKPSRGLPAPTFFVPLEDNENLSGRDFGDWPLGKRRCEIEQKPADLGELRLCSTVLFQSRQMFFGDCAEGIVRGSCRDDLVELLLLRRVFAVGEPTIQRTGRVVG